MTYLIAILITLGILLVCGVLGAVTTNYHNWKYYKHIYSTLNKDDWHTSGSSYRQWYNIHTEGTYNEQIYFANDGDFKLGHNSYLWSGFPFCLDPYTLYWSIKYNRWFKNNVL